MGIWHLKIECIAFVVACVINPDPMPPVQREFQTKIQCDRALIELSKTWQPTQGAWTMNCVQR